MDEDPLEMIAIHQYQQHKKWAHIQLTSAATGAATVYNQQEHSARPSQLDICSYQGSNNLKQPTCNLHHTFKLLSS